MLLFLKNSNFSIDIPQNLCVPLTIASVYILLLLLAQELHEDFFTSSLKGKTLDGAVVQLNFWYPNFSFSLLLYLNFRVVGIQLKCAFFPSLLPSSSSWLTVFCISGFIGWVDPLHPRWTAAQPPASRGCPSTWHWEWPCPHPQLGWGKHWLGLPLHVGSQLAALIYSVVVWNFLLAKIAGGAFCKVCFTCTQQLSSISSLVAWIINDVMIRVGIDASVWYFRPNNENNR